MYIMCPLFRYNAPCVKDPNQERLCPNCILHVIISSEIANYIIIYSCPGTIVVNFHVILHSPNLHRVPICQCREAVGLAGARVPDSKQPASSQRVGLWCFNYASSHRHVYVFGASLTCYHTELLFPNHYRRTLPAFYLSNTKKF